MQLDNRQIRHLITRFFLIPFTLFLFASIFFAGYFKDDFEPIVITYMGRYILGLIIYTIFISGLIYTHWKLEFKGANVLFLFQIYLEILWLIREIEFANASDLGIFHRVNYPIGTYITQGVVFLGSSFLAIDAIIYYIKKWLKYIEERKSVKRIQKLLNKK